MYNNNNNNYRSNGGGGGGYQQNNYGRSNYNNGGNYYNNGGGGQRQVKKHSGSKTGYSHGQQDHPYVTGWNYSRRNGMTKIICGPYKNTKKVTSKTGKVWENWCAKIQVGNQQPYLCSCMFDVQNRKVVIHQLGWVLNPAKNYCGTFTKRN